MKLKLPSSNPLAKKRPVGSTPAPPAPVTPSPAAPPALWSSTAATDVVAPVSSPSPMPVSGSPPMPVPAPGGEPLAPPAVAASAGTVIGQVLPMYFVGDESHSMAGEPISAVNQGLVDLRDEVAKHPLIGKKVRFGIITFADTAQTRLELSELSEELMLPPLAPRGRGTSYASAFEALRHTIPGDIALLKASGYQVHRPSVFFLSDGQPTEKEDRWRTRLDELKDPCSRSARTSSRSASATRIRM